MTSTYAQGDKVTYLGHPATVMHGNQPAPEWTGSDRPGRHVNIRFDREVRGHSRQFDIEASAVLPAVRRELLSIGDVVIRDATGATAVVIDIDTGYISVRYDVTDEFGGGDRSEFTKVTA